MKIIFCLAFVLMLGCGPTQEPKMARIELRLDSLQIGDSDSMLIVGVRLGRVRPVEMTAEMQKYRFDYWLTGTFCTVKDHHIVAIWTTNNKMGN